MTRLWISGRALKGMDKYAPDNFGAQLDRWQGNGFGNYVNHAVRQEGRGVWRIGSGGSNFRLLGFPEFGGIETDQFIVIMGGMKPKKLHEWIAEVARVRDSQDWSRAVP